MKFDGTINIPTVVTVLAMAGSGISAFVSVRDVQTGNQQAIANLREADMRHELALRELKADSSGPLAEIKQDIKDLRSDIKEVRSELRAEFKKR